MNRTIIITLGLLAALLTACLPLGMAAGCTSLPPTQVKTETPAQDPTLQYELDPELTFKLELNYAIPLLADLYDKKDTVKIRNLLKDTNKAVRMLSIQTLVKLDDKESIPEIKKLLNDKEGMVREAAEEALRLLGVPDKEIEEAKEGKK